MDRIGVVDTMFARYDMGAEAVDELKQSAGFGERFEVVRTTVPGFKDLGVACKRPSSSRAADRGRPGHAGEGGHRPGRRARGVAGDHARPAPREPHVLEVFVHENEEEDPARLAAVCIDRARKHARNAYWMLYEPEQLAPAGQGVRQGYGDAGPIVAPHS